MPVPLLGEYAAYCSESAQALGALLCKDVLEIADITLECIPGITYTGWNRTEKAVLQLNRLVFIGEMYYSYAEIIIGGNGNSISTHTRTAEGTMSKCKHWFR